MTESPRYRLPLLAASQAQKHITVNEALVAIDALVAARALDRVVTTPPASPVDGDAYLVPAGAIGAWSGWQDSLAYCSDGAWRRILPVDGMQVWISSESRPLYYSARDGAWIGFAGADGPVAPLSSPSGFSFPFGHHPVSVWRTPSGVKTDFDPTSYAKRALAGPTYHVNGIAGNNANAGTAATAPLKSISVATTKGNAGGVPFRVLVQAGDYSRDTNFTDSGPMVYPTVEAAYIAVGGRVTCWAGLHLAWPASPDATHADTYSLTRPTVAVVLDTATLRGDGFPTELKRVVDAAACNATPGSWAQVGTTLYVRRSDGLAPTIGNTRVLLVIDNFRANSTSKSLYLQGFDFWGGIDGGVFVNGGGTRDIMIVDCSVRYAGGPSNLFDGFRILDSNGLVALVGCTAASNARDGFNFHFEGADKSVMPHLTINCRAYDNGRHASVSCNGLATHDGLVGLDIAGQYHGNFGPNVSPIQTCQLWCAGTSAKDSLGDSALGGTTTPADFETLGTARLWLTDTASAGSAVSLRAAGSSQIRVRRHASGSGQVESAVVGATISTF